MPEILITNSSKSTFTCPYRYYLSYILGKKRAEEPDYLDIGKAFHQLIEWYYTYGYDVTIIKFGEILSTQNTIRLKALASFEKYLSKYSNVFQNVIPEQSYKIWLFDIDEFHIYAAGKIDLIDINNGQIIEFKTTGKGLLLSESNSEYNFWHGIEQKYQHVGYYLAAKKLGYNVDSVKYIAVSRSDIKPKKGNTKHPEPETVDEYIERYKETIDIREYELVITDDTIERYMEHERKIAMEIVWNIRNNIWNKRPDICESPYRCSFFNHCNFGLDIFDPVYYIDKDETHEELETDELSNIEF